MLCHHKEVGKSVQLREKKQSSVPEEIKDATLLSCWRRRTGPAARVGRQPPKATTGKQMDSLHRPVDSQTVNPVDRISDLSLPEL